MDSESNKKTQAKKSNDGTWIAIGTAIGIALGVVFDHLALGIALGAAVGAAVDASSHFKNKNQ